MDKKIDLGIRGDSPLPERSRFSCCRSIESRGQCVKHVVDIVNQKMWSVVIVDHHDLIRECRGHGTISRKLTMIMITRNQGVIIVEIVLVVALRSKACQF